MFSAAANIDVDASGGLKQRPALSAINIIFMNVSKIRINKKFKNLQDTEQLFKAAVGLGGRGALSRRQLLHFGSFNYVL